MHVQSSGETFKIEDGVVQLAFDLSRSEAGYLVISKPESRDPTADEFYGANHHVEVKDQLYGRYGGLEELTITNDHALSVRLSVDVPGVGQDISISTAKPMTGEQLDHLRQLERS